MFSHLCFGAVATGHRENGFRFGGKVQEVAGYVGLKLRRDEAGGEEGTFGVSARTWSLKSWASCWLTTGCRFLVFMFGGSAGGCPNRSLSCDCLTA